MKWIFPFLLLLSFPASSQYFRVNPAIADSLGPESFEFTVNGFADFNDSMVVTIELISLDSIPVVFFSGNRNFVYPDSSTLMNFTYDTLNTSFSVGLGTFSHKEMYLIIRSFVLGELKEQLIINRFEAIPNEEE